VQRKTKVNNPVRLACTGMWDESCVASTDAIEIIPSNTVVDLQMNELQVMLQ
jgi:hypothetical protein